MGAGIDQNGPAAGGSGRLDVRRLIANQDGALQVDTELIAGPKEQAGRRFAAVARLRRRVWTDQELRDAPAGRLDGLPKAQMDVINRLPADQASANGRLIRQNDELTPGGGEARQGVQRPRDDLDIFPSPDIIRPHPIDDPITVQEHDPGSARCDNPMLLEDARDR